MLCKIKPVVGHLNAKSRQTIMFAARELSRYLGMAQAGGDFPVMPVAEPGSDQEATLFLTVGHGILPEVKEPYFDDAIYIETKGNQGMIAATNARAVLIAVYRFLRENGFSFSKPGRLGERIPEKPLWKQLHIVEAASYRHRGICIEGSSYQEGLLELIDWLPKVGMNAYFIQFPEPDHFLRRYYEQTKGFALSGEESAAMTAVIREEIERRSLLYHAVGHGWTCEVMGVEPEAIHKVPENVSEEQRSMLAQLNGERDFFRGNPLNTNLCYSQQKVRDKMTDTILEYCKAHEKVDYLHFWIADGGNNNCECEECVKMRASDHYVKMLNELDAKLTANHLDTKIVFLIYSGLVWAPIKERIRNQDRFIMMFAPFLRDYTDSLDPELPMEIPPYNLNHQPDILTDISEHLGYYKDWRSTFEGDSFDFDYHYCQEYLFELSGYHLAKVLHQDIVNLKKLGMNGFMSCQVQRVFLPTALGMNIMAETLWNREASYEELVDKILKEQFEEDGIIVKQYLQELSLYSCEEEMLGKGDLRGTECQSRMRQAIDCIVSFRKEWEPKLTEGRKNGTYQPQILQNWEGLLFYGALHEAIYRYYLAESEEEKAERKEIFARLADSRMEQFKSEFDRLACFIPGA